VYSSNLMNRLSSTMIGGKILLDIWAGGAAQDYDLLRVFRCPAHFSVNNDKLNLRVKKFVILGVKRNLKGTSYGTRKQEDRVEQVCHI